MPKWVGMLAISKNIKILDTSKVDSVLILGTYVQNFKTSIQNNLTLKNTGENMKINIFINCCSDKVKQYKRSRMS